MSALSLTETINKLKEYRKTDKIDKQTLAYAEYWLCYAKEHGVTGDCCSNKMIVITTLQELPEYCYGCPCHDGDNGECQADKERRRSLEYRPYWCPLNEIRDKEIVRCKDCKKYGDNKKCPIEALIYSDSKQFFAFDENWFCADGERK